MELLRTGRGFGFDAAPDADDRAVCVVLLILRSTFCLLSNAVPSIVVDNR